ncbi:hypothetical protein GOBAR_DD20933 [Gossypium barbadense]|nr:hypothetical protein GOBAR_DD20933 [Gossypium barbadense]
MGETSWAATRLTNSSREGQNATKGVTLNRSLFLDFPTHCISRTECEFGSTKQSNESERGAVEVTHLAASLMLGGRVLEVDFGLEDEGKTAQRNFKNAKRKLF